MVVGGGTSNRALTSRVVPRTTVHVEADPEQSPDQPANSDPITGTAVSVTDVLAGYTSVQSAPQLIPASLLVTAPAPGPDTDTVRPNRLVGPAGPCGPGGPTTFHWSRISFALQLAFGAMTWMVPLLLFTH